MAILPRPQRVGVRPPPAERLGPDGMPYQPYQPDGQPMDGMTRGRFAISAQEAEANRGRGQVKSQAKKLEKVGKQAARASRGASGLDTAIARAPEQAQPSLLKAQQQAAQQAQRVDPTTRQPPRTRRGF